MAALDSISQKFLVSIKVCVGRINLNLKRTVKSPYLLCHDKSYIFISLNFSIVSLIHKSCFALLRIINE